MHFIFGQIEFAIADRFVGEELDFLEAHNLRTDQDIPMRMGGGGGQGRRGASGFGSGNFEHAHLCVADRIGVIVHVHSLHVGLALFEVEVLDIVLLAGVQVDGFLVHENERTREVNFANDIRFTGDVDDHEIVAGDRTQADGIRRIGFVRPVIVCARQMQKTRFCKPRA